MSLKSLEKAIPALLEHQESVDFSLLARGGCLPRAELVPAWPHMPGAVNGDAELLQVPLGKCCWLRICQAFLVGRLEVKNKQVCSMLNMPTSCHTNVQHG